MSEQSANKRLAINVLLLYGRMMLLLVVSLYTSRVVLAALGIEDYGIYDVVGGMVSMFSFINLAMGASSSRFITFALGKENKTELIKIFNTAFLIHLIIAVVILIFCETLGLWWLYNKLVIPTSRLNASLLVFQFSVFSCVFSVICIPFNATIVAHERMKAFAYISLIDALLKLIIAYLVSISSVDKLILYAFLIMCIYLSDIIIYIVYCVKSFEEVKFKRILDKMILKDMSLFACWSLVGKLAYVGYTQGLNILLNLFFGPVVNAARGISSQIQVAVRGFITNFQMAVNPQITKSYAQDNYTRLHSLIYASSKFSFYLMLCIALPLAIESKKILSLWLVDVPNYTVQFTIITLAIMLIDTLSNPINTANNATGNIKKYQIIEGFLLLMIVPIAYFVLKLGGNPTSVFWVQLVIMYLTQFVRMAIVCNKIKMSIREYCIKILIRVILVSTLSPIVPLYFYFNLDTSLISSIVIILIAIFSVMLFSYTVGIDSNERNFINQKIKLLINKFIINRNSGL